MLLFAYITLLVSVRPLLAARLPRPDNILSSSISVPCRQMEIPEELAAFHKKAAAREKAMASAKDARKLTRRDEQAASADQEQITIDTYIQVVSTSSEAPNHFSNDTIKSQIKLLNDFFEPVHISFKILAVNWDVNPDASNGQTRSDPRLHWLYHRGDNRHLNIFYVNSTFDGSAYALLPGGALTSDYEQNFSDAVVLPADFILGSTLRHSIAHEVGHWLGLGHTFGEKIGFNKTTGQSIHSGCKPPGDNIADTTAHPGPSRNCSAARALDVCPEEKKLNLTAPIYNLMNYVEDSCLENKTEPAFTPIQRQRMREAWREFRSKPLDNPNWPKELRPLKPEYPRGKKTPIYPNPENKVLVNLRCHPYNNFTAIDETREEYCGTFHWCLGQAQLKWGKDQQKVTEQGFACMDSKGLEY